MPQKGTVICFCRPPRILIALFKPSCPYFEKHNQIRSRVARPFIFTADPSSVLALNPSVIESALKFSTFDWIIDGLFERSGFRIHLHAIQNSYSGCFGLIWGEIGAVAIGI